MAKDPVPGSSLLGLPIVAEPGLSRVLIEHGDGRWSTCLVRKSIAEQFPNRPVDAECTFTMDSVVDTARKAFSSDPAIADDKHAGRKLAAAVLMFSMALGILNEKEEAA
ncbi:hypothetical protein HJC03_23610 [Rhizobium sp. NLR4b]|uniref:hypothetical protein n=1 Tax=Rhizobium sp. NLR4b TaxID=2731118 RepID=UPI001C83470D|nr:hypothetical protein [Rhizobium sp. NLR4b]MBX5253360.1 hypothetical protein [Rhizobium sp. NLR4b]